MNIKAKIITITLVVLLVVSSMYHVVRNKRETTRISREESEKCEVGPSSIGSSRQRVRIFSPASYGDVEVEINQWIAKGGKKVLGFSGLPAGGIICLYENDYHWARSSPLYPSGFGRTYRGYCPPPARYSYSEPSSYTAGYGYDSSSYSAYSDYYYLRSTEEWLRDVSQEYFGVNPMDKFDGKVDIFYFYGGGSLLPLVDLWDLPQPMRCPPPPSYGGGYGTYEGEENSQTPNKSEK